MELKETNHNYYSSGNNFYVGNRNGENFGRYEAETWEQFKDDWFIGDNEIDHDYNHCFRFDIKAKWDFEAEKEIDGEFSLWLFFILQRKGIYRPVFIKTITEKDLPEIESYLKECWSYLQNQWGEII
ncbi:MULTISPECIES: hypothetical protein [Bacillus]|uniref:hypothetical protein n=1 Tax=Bacillus TaxID=1386 RepID=UPI000992C31C|nr:hypothetical protein [Bacillus pseudomycoides]MED1478187.1 hypothetical protein [Bacillus pseudomycoides]OOR54381.1 hypothetical protein BLX05_02575 [Bacillus pseudomycoides]PEO45590.1 hypothetical protein CN559_17430 [Bacillus pseudomycoides]